MALTFVTRPRESSRRSKCYSRWGPSPSPVCQSRCRCNRKQHHNSNSMFHRRGLLFCVMRPKASYVSVRFCAPRVAFVVVLPVADVYENEVVTPFAEPVFWLHAVLAPLPMAHDFVSLPRPSYSFWTCLLFSLAGAGLSTARSSFCV